MSKIENLYRIFPFMESAKTPLPIGKVVISRKSTPITQKKPVSKTLTALKQNTYQDRPYVMVFDVETTGLLPKTVNWQNRNRDELDVEISRHLSADTNPAPTVTDSPCQSAASQPYQSVNPLPKVEAPDSPCQSAASQPLPYIIQLSYVIYDVANQSLKKIYNEYIQLPEDFILSPEITILTGITQDMCKTQGIPIQQALKEFATDYETCHTIVSHNIRFDTAFIRLEMARNCAELSPYRFSERIFNTAYNKEKGLENYCTMENGRDICNIYIESSKNKGNFFKKSPKLVELYKELFGETPVNLHNSLVDTLVCLRCYLKMRHSMIIDDALFKSLLP